MRNYLVLFPMMVIAGCGGGGSSTSPVVLPPTTNTPPQISSAAAVSVTENQTVVTTVTATDADGDQLSFSISGGDDAEDFSIRSTGVLTFASAPDFELPSDSGQDNVYNITVSVSDGSATASRDLIITVNNDREGIAVRRVATGFSQPTFAETIPGTSDIFVAEKGGRIYRLNTVTGQRTLHRTVKDISTAGEGGLLGIVADPGFATNETFYIFVVAQNGAINIRSIFGTGSGFETKMVIPHPGFTNHYGGWLDIGPDGHLYIATGDGGGAGDPNNNAQNNFSLLGKILRISVSPCATCGVTPQPIYAIPDDNPFVRGPGIGAPEIFALGFRNPFRASFYQEGLMIGDVGQDNFEEVDQLPFIGGGLNYGWPFFEGTSAFRGAPSTVTVSPVTEYAHGTGAREGQSITGGLVYSGSITDLSQKYIFADFVTGNIWSVPFNLFDFNSAEPVSTAQYERRNDDFTPDVGSIDQIVAFEQGDNGNVYIVDFDGDIFVIEPS